MWRWHLVEGIDLWASVNSFTAQHVPQVDQPVAGRRCISQDGIAVLCHEAVLATGTDSVNGFLCCTTAENVVQVNGYTGQVISSITCWKQPGAELIPKGSMF